jgi:hypothetical protein
MPQQHLDAGPVSRAPAPATRPYQPIHRPSALRYASELTPTEAVVCDAKSRHYVRPDPDVVLLVGALLPRYISASRAALDEKLVTPSLQVTMSRPRWSEVAGLIADDMRWIA